MNTSSGNIIVAVTGGVAAFKAAALTSKLAQQGFEVQNVLTTASESFVGDSTFVALSGRPVAKQMHDARWPLGPHIELARWAELLVVAPATANFIAKAANGLADDLLSTLYLACTCPVLVAPAMNAEMWTHSAVQRNVGQLRNDGVFMVGPDEGWLSCRIQGAGRMADPEEIVGAIQEIMTHRSSTS